MRWVVLVSTVVAGLVMAAACTPPCRCYVGLFPLNGSTAVAPDAPLAVTGSLDPELLALGGAIVLEGPTGIVEVDLVDDESGITVWPVEPLAGGEYELRAYAGDDGNDVAHGHRTGETPTSTWSRFTVGPASPRVLALFDDNGLYILFSEPIDVGSLTGRVRVDDRPTTLTAIDDTLFRIGPSEVFASDGRSGDDGVVDVLDGVLTASGQPVDPIGGLSHDREWSLDRAAGGTWCDCW